MHALPAQQATTVLKLQLRLFRVLPAPTERLPGALTWSHAQPVTLATRAVYPLPPTLLVKNALMDTTALSELHLPTSSPVPTEHGVVELPS